MASTKEIKRRIRSVQNTEQITRAMEMVAGAKLRKAQALLEESRPYGSHIQQVINRVLAYSLELEHPFLEKREGQSCGYLVITSDRGLCGGYNTNLMRKVTGELNPGKDNQFMVVGRKGKDYLRRRGYQIVSEYLNLEDTPGWETAQNMGETGIQMYLDGVIDELYVCYNYFINALHQKPVLYKLLPMESPDEGELPDPGETLYFNYEPSAESVLERLLPRYINSIVYSALLEAKTSEHGARRTAMNAATKNAEEVIENLTYSYNQARQAAITQELLEIVSSAEALKEES